MLVVASFLVALVVWPMAAVLERSLQDVGPERLGDILGRSSVRTVATFTLWQAGLSALLTVLLGLPIAAAIARFRFPGRRLLRAIVVVPFVLPTVVVAAAIRAAADRVGLGLDRSVAAILAAHVFFNLAVVVRVVGAAWSELDRRPLEAAQVLGASPWRAFRSVTLPSLRPALAAAGLVVFLFSFTSFGVILILGGPRRATLETEIYRNAIFRQEFDVAAVLALLQLLVVAVLSLLAARSQRRLAAERRGRVRPLERRPSTTSERLQVALAWVVALVVIGIPVAALVEASLVVGDGHGLDHYRSLLDPLPLLPVTAARALATSIGFALLAASIATIVGLAAAVAIVRTGIAGRVLESVALVPLGVSAVTLGFGYLLAFTVFDLRRSIWIIPVAHAVVGLPFVMANVVPALRAVDERTREAAAVLGASPLTVVRTVDLPALRRAAATGAGFAFAISLGEFGATSFLSRADTAFTAPLAVFRLLSQPGATLRGQALALSVVIGILVAVVAALVDGLAYRRIGARDGGAADRDRTLEPGAGPAW